MSMCSMSSHKLCSFFHPPIRVAHYPLDSQSATKILLTTWRRGGANFPVNSLSSCRVILAPGHVPFLGVSILKKWTLAPSRRSQLKQISSLISLPFPIGKSEKCIEVLVIAFPFYNKSAANLKIFVHKISPHFLDWLNLNNHRYITLEWSPVHSTAHSHYT